MNSSKLLTFIEEAKRNIKLTNLITIALVVIVVMLALLYILLAKDQTSRLGITLLITAIILSLPYFFNRLGYHNVSRLVLSILLPLAIIFISIDNKNEVINDNIINPVNYFDVRIALINAFIIPIIIFSAREGKWLITSVIPSILSIVFFDPIHNFFGVGYYQSGMTSPDYYISANVFTIFAVLFIGLIVIFLKSQVLKSDYKQTSENKKTKDFLSQMIKLSNSENINNGIVEAAKLEIMNTAYFCLKTSRVSIWSFDKKYSRIKCEHLMENGQLKESDVILEERDYPSYFEAIKTQDMVIAEDAYTSPATSEFSDNYLKPLSIYSMMDVPFLRKGELGGVICLEHQYEYKKWGAVDSLLLKALADFLSYSIISKEKIAQNKLLKEKNKEIISINSNLESLVDQRTAELEKKNKQLTEYAYINSHVLRAPVARISGLYNLFKMENVSFSNNSTLTTHMRDSIYELEQITQRINKAIEDHGHIDRTHVK